jgi:Cd2+/Zn2+-exporting ATPase
MLKFTNGQRIILTSVLILISFILYKAIGYKFITIMFMFVSTIMASIPILKNMLFSLHNKILGINALVMIATLGAIIIGEYWEAAAVTYLFMLGDYLESQIIEKTKAPIKSLLNLSPKKTKIILGGMEHIISFDKVRLGDHVLVKDGEIISVDGTVVEGSAYVNQANITGESIPVRRSVYDFVYSGTVLESDYIIVNAERVGQDTTFAHILHMVDDAQNKKAKTQTVIDKFLRYYTPSIIVLSLVLYFFTDDIRLSLTLLIVACPGALVISTPVSIVAGLGNGANNGVLINGGDVMEKLGKVNVLAFDKTGTLTVGEPTVNNIKTFEITERELLRIAAIGEAYSDFPLAKSIIQKANLIIGDIQEKAEDVSIMIGLGVKYNLNETTFLVGNYRLFKEMMVDLKRIDSLLNEEEAKGHTVVIVGTLVKVLGYISIGDPIRNDAKKLIRDLRISEIKKLVMLTGENKLATQSTANELGFDTYYEELLPVDKARIIKQLQAQYGHVGMVGDGVNDVPAMAYADLGIAVGGVGKDVAMETADVVIMSEEIKKIDYAICLSRATIKILKQNISLSLLVSMILLIGVLIKVVDMALGMLIHEMSVLLVILNTFRLISYRRKK